MADNKSPSNDWLEMVQNIAIELTHLKFQINQGNAAMIPQYRYTLDSWEQNLRQYATNEEKDQLKNIKSRMALGQSYKFSINLLTGKQVLQSQCPMDKQMSNLEEYEDVLREIIKRNNFLTITTDKRRPLT